MRFDDMMIWSLTVSFFKHLFVISGCDLTGLSEVKFGMKTRDTL